MSGIRVVLDYVPNHTSNESDWFVKSAQKDPNYIDFYVWADGKADPKNPEQVGPPNNWVSKVILSVLEVFGVTRVGQ